MPQGGTAFLIEPLRNWWQATGHPEEQELPMSTHLTHPIRPAGRGLASALTLTLALSPLALSAETVQLSDTLTAPILDVVPRTEAERARIAAATAPTTDFSAPERFEQNPAGAATTRARTDADAFSQFSANIGFEGEMTFKLGNGLFKKLWVSSPVPPRPATDWGRSTMRALASAAT